MKNDKQKIAEAYSCYRKSGSEQDLGDVIEALQKVNGAPAHTCRSFVRNFKGLLCELADEWESDRPKRLSPKYRTDINVLLVGARSFTLGIYDEEKDGVHIVPDSGDRVREPVFYPWSKVKEWRY